MVLCKLCCCGFLAVLLPYVVVFLIAIRNSGDPRTRSIYNNDVPEDKKARKVDLADFKYKSVEPLVEFNHLPPIAFNPFLTEKKAATAKENKENAEKFVCAVEFLDEGNFVYQLRTIPSSEFKASEKLLFNHKGRCGVCSNLQDFVTWSRIFHDAQPKLLEMDYLYSAAQSMLNKDIGTQSFVNSGFSQPCSELLYFKVVHGMKNCFSECFRSDDFEGCERACDDRETADVFAKYAGRHFNMENNKELFDGKLPQKNLALKKKLDEWKPPAYSNELIKDLKSKVLTNETPFPSVDPYEDPKSDHVIQWGQVCAAKFVAPANKEYSLKTYASAEAANKDGAIVTHEGSCGFCSSLKDLAVYIEKPDLTQPARACAMKSFLSKDVAKQCLVDIGFSEPCASMWLSNSLFTRQKCTTICLFHYFSENVLFGRLNSCLMCDEQMSGPFFKKYAGRTRRNSGLTSAIQRPGPSIAQIVHKYPETKMSALKSKPVQEEKDEL